MDIKKLITEAQQQLAAWAQKELQAHDQVKWLQGRIETLQQIEQAQVDEQAAGAALKVGE
jgi:predicted flap endonuclease-1-like 5' DNA nuclease